VRFAQISPVLGIKAPETPYPLRPPRIPRVLRVKNATGPDAAGSNRSHQTAAVAFEPTGEFDLGRMLTGFFVQI